MTRGLTQFGADAIATEIAGTWFSGSTNVIELIDSGDAVIATASDVSVTATNNVLTLTSAGGAGVSSTATAVGFLLKDSGGTNTYYSFKNETLTITPANQNTDDTFTSTAHGLTDGQPLQVGGGLPTVAGSALTDGQTVFVRDTTANTFKICRSPGEDAIDVTTVAGTDTTFQVTSAVGDASSDAILRLTSGTALTSGETVTFSSFSWTVPVFSVGAS